MKKILKYGLHGLALVLAMGVGAFICFLLTFNPNDYKPQIIQAVKDRQQRTLKLGGEIRLAFLPGFGVNVENISLSEHNGDKEFASIESAHISLALLPLLSKRVEVNGVHVSGVKLNIERFKNGKSNFDDLADNWENAGQILFAVPATFDIDTIRIEKAEANYRDEISGAKYALKDFSLKAGKIANGVPFRFDLNVLVQANKPRLDFTAKIKTVFTYNLEKNFYKVGDLDMQVKGDLLDIVNLHLNASGGADINLNTREFNARKLHASVSGMKGKDNFDASADFPLLNVTAENIAAEKLNVKAAVDGEIGKVKTSLNLQEMQGNAKSFKSGGLVLEFGLIQQDQSYKLKLSTPLTASLDTRQYNFSNLVFALNAEGEKFHGKSISSEMKGSVQVDAERESVQLNLAGGLLQSQAKIKFAVKGFTEPAIRFDVDVDQFDADQYLPKKKSGAGVTAEPLVREPFDLSALQGLNLDGSVRCGALNIASVKASKVRIDMKANKGMLNVNPLSANLFDGSINGKIEADISGVTPVFSVEQTLSGVQFGQLLKEVGGIDIVQGKGTVAANIMTQGNTVSALTKGLNGSVKFDLLDGEIKGINLNRQVLEVQNMSRRRGVQSLKPNIEDKTEFSELQAGFKIKNGVAHNDDLLLKSQLFKVSGKGDIDFANSSINYSSKASMPVQVDGKSGSVTLPVQLQGKFADMKFKVDYGAFITAVDKKKAAVKARANKQETRQKLNDKLKNGPRALPK